MSEVMTSIQAKKEVLDWIETIGLKPRKIAKLSDSIDEIVEFLQFGDAVISDGKITFKLEKPLSDGKDKLTFNNKRYTVDEVTKAGSGHKKITDKAYAVLGGMFTEMVNIGDIGNMTSDFVDLQQIASLFLPN